MPKVAFLTPASPNAGFYSEIAAINLALKKIPWTRWEPQFFVTMGPRTASGEYEDSFERWRPYLREVNFSYVSEIFWERSENWAQVDHSILMAPRSADVFVKLDADTLPVASLESVLDEVHAKQSVAGVMAHFPPPCVPTIDVWRELMAKFGISGANLSFEYSYSLVGQDVLEERRRAPIYFNGGVVFYPRCCFERFVEPFMEICSNLAASDENDFFSAQIATTLALVKLGLPTNTLPMRYNYPNDDTALRTKPGELENVAIFHYLRTNAFDRRKIFTGASEYQNFLSQKLIGSNLGFQAAVRRIFGSTYPFGSLIS